MAVLARGWVLRRNACTPAVFRASSHACGRRISSQAPSSVGTSTAASRRSTSTSTPPTTTSRRGRSSLIRAARLPDRYGEMEK
eukprot:5255589-Pleurochrysis_carterae.AAC.2